MRKPALRTDSGRVDPRVERTRNALVEALFELVAERRWEKIRVQDVLDRTGISRSAFYAHFDNKYDLLTARIPEMLAAFVDDAEGLPDLSGLFVHVDEVRDVLYPLMSQPVLGDIVDTHHRHLVTAWTDYLDGRVDGAIDPLLAHVLAGGTLSAMRAYMAADDDRDPHDAAGAVSRWVAAVVAAA